MDYFKKYEKYKMKYLGGARRPRHTIDGYKSVAFHPLIYENDIWYILLAARAVPDQYRDRPVTFGGGCEVKDRSTLESAYREFYEESGIVQEPDALFVRPHSDGKPVLHYIGTYFNRPKIDKYQIESWTRTPGEIIKSRREAETILSKYFQDILYVGSGLFMVDLDVFLGATLDGSLLNTPQNLILEIVPLLSTVPVITRPCLEGIACSSSDSKHQRTAHPEHHLPRQASTANVCKYGAQCYRTNPEHIAKYHSPAPAPAPAPDVCKYGAQCYRTNPEHIAKYHS
jgi:8-oxo-dGTP pyrophosphatase MutT (NUDIX family)